MVAELAVDILRNLGLTRVRLMTNNPRKASALRGSIIEVADIVPVRAGMNIHNAGYLLTKATKLGHHLPAP